MPITPDILLDIDRTLAIRLVNDEIYNGIKLLARHPTLKSFTTYLLYEGHSYHYLCILLPGLYELIRFLAENTSINFFSNAERSANEEFVKKIIINVISRHSQVKIFARYNLKNDKKDLEHIGKDLKCSLLIDDHKPNICPNQKKNSLIVEGVDLGNIDCTTVYDIFAVNQIFYVAGLLQKAFELGKDSFLDHLVELQKPFADSYFAKWKYYEAGLACLRRYTPSLEFFTNKLDLRKLGLPVTPKKKEETSAELLSKSMSQFLGSGASSPSSPTTEPVPSNDDETHVVTFHY